MPFNANLYTSMEVLRGRLKKHLTEPDERLLLLVKSASYAANAYVLKHSGVPNGIRTRIAAVKGRCPNR